VRLCFSLISSHCCTALSSLFHQTPLSRPLLHSFLHCRSLKMLPFQPFRLSLLAVLALCLVQHTNALNPRKIKPQASQTTKLKLDRNYENFFHFHSRPDIVAPRWEIWMYDKKAVSPGYWFIAPYESLDQITRGSPWVGPFIYDMSGQVVWAGKQPVSSVEFLSSRSSPLSHLLQQAPLVWTLC
jgi:hypothetical protein